MRHDSSENDHSWRLIVSNAMHYSLVASHERHGVANKKQLDSLCDCLFSETTRKAPKLRITGSLWGESYGEWWIPLRKSQ